MFEIFVGTQFRFMARRKGAYVVSGLLVLASVVSLILHGGARESIDFTGGALIEVSFGTPAVVGDVRSAAAAAGLEEAEIQMVEGGQEAILRFRAEGSPQNAFQSFDQRFEAAHPGNPVELRRIETVGPKVGKELEQKASLAILWSLILILAYIAWRFTRVSFGLASVIALFHTIIIVLGVFSVLNIEVSLTVVAAFLTLAGYAINDTIVVFDRIRENLGLVKRKTLAEIIDLSVNQTLSRTVLTGGSLFLAVIVLYAVGGPVIHDFAFAILVGMIVGTYSSVFVASALALDLANWWIRRKAAREAAAHVRSKPAVPSAG